MKAVITGATRGIGLAIATRLLEEGFDIALSARGEKALLEVQTSLQKRFPQREIIICSADLSLREDVLKLAAFVNSHWKSIDLLVNNAGAFIPGTIAQEQPEDFERMMHLNVFAAYYLTKELLPGMLERRKGHIFTICSSASLAPTAGIGSYSASKYALLGLTRNLQEELKEQGIKVTAILPGSTFTSSWEGTDIPKEKFIQPEDIAASVIHAYSMSASTLVEQIILNPIHKV